MSTSDITIQASMELFRDVCKIIEDARAQVAVSVNRELTLMYWHIGERINRDILHNERADYGKAIVSTLSTQLTARYGKDYNSRNLHRMVQFARQFEDFKIVSTLSTQLPWSVFMEVLTLKDSLAREFYITMAASERWSVRELREKKRGMQQFLMELGGGFSFVDRQKRMIIDGEDYYLDLLFYHRKLHRLVAIDLKRTKFEAAYKGQMELYLRWLDKYERQPGEESPLGLLLCAAGNDEQIQLLQLGDAGIQVSQYYTVLPEKDLLKSQLQKQIAQARYRIDNF